MEIKLGLYGIRCRLAGDQMEIRWGFDGLYVGIRQGLDENWMRIRGGLDRVQMVFR